MHQLRERPGDNLSVVHVLPRLKPAVERAVPPVQIPFTNDTSSASIVFSAQYRALFSRLEGVAPPESVTSTGRLIELTNTLLVRPTLAVQQPQHRLAQPLPGFGQHRSKRHSGRAFTIPSRLERPDKFFLNGRELEAHVRARLPLFCFLGSSVPQSASLAHPADEGTQYSAFNSAPKAFLRSHDPEAWRHSLNSCNRITDRLRPEVARPTFVHRPRAGRSRVQHRLLTLSWNTVRASSSKAAPTGRLDRPPARRQPSDRPPRALSIIFGRRITRQHAGKQTSDHHRGSGVGQSRDPQS